MRHPLPPPQCISLAVKTAIASADAALEDYTAESITSPVRFVHSTQQQYLNLQVNG